VAVKVADASDDNADWAKVEDDDNVNVNVIGLLKQSKLLYMLPVFRYSIVTGLDSGCSSFGMTATERSMTMAELSWNMERERSEG
jgi:hypothetical protein